MSGRATLSRRIASRHAGNLRFPGSSKVERATRVFRWRNRPNARFARVDVHRDFRLQYFQTSGHSAV
ncbi:hypothetical protein C8039_10915 [Halogeometricum sp. wsp3]|nr:hypothetical protein C8039_10915 [Halogeometricum sp. wsp3]